MDPDRLAFDRAVRGMAGVLDVDDGRPEPGDVTLRVVAGHGDRLRRAARAIAPAGVAVHVLEDDLVSALPAVQPTIDPSPAQRAASSRARREAEAATRARRADGTGATAGRAGSVVGAGEELRCSFVFCGHRTTTGELGSAAGDPCRRKTRVPNGWLPCPGHLQPALAPRRRWWGGVR